MNVFTVSLPDGPDPNTFFVQDGDARQFQSLLEAAGHDASNHPTRSPYRSIEPASGREIDWTKPERADSGGIWPR